MRVITGLFDSRERADEVVAALEDAGVPSDAISLIGPEDDGETSSAAEGAGIGAAVGGAGGLLAGLGLFAIPGIGPVVGAGWLAATLAGVAAGGIAGGVIGALADAGVDERDAHVYAEGVRRGGTLVTARVDNEQTDAAMAILGDAGAADVNERRSAYEARGWTGFDPVGDPWEPTPEEVAARRATAPVPPVR